MDTRKIGALAQQLNVVEPDRRRRWSEDERLRTVTENRSGLAGRHDHHDDLIALCRARRVDAAVSPMEAHVRDLAEGIALDSRRPAAFDVVDVFARRDA